jgi:hypothetical protein
MHPPGFHDHEAFAHYSDKNPSPAQKALAIIAVLMMPFMD